MLSIKYMFEEYIIKEYPEMFNCFAIFEKNKTKQKF